MVWYSFSADGLWRRAIPAGSRAPARPLPGQILEQLVGLIKRADSHEGRRKDVVPSSRERPATPIAWKPVNEQAHEGAVPDTLDCRLDGAAHGLGALDQALTVAKV